MPTSIHNASFWLEASGVRLAIGPGGVLVGRSAKCDIVIPDQSISRFHALFRATRSVPEVISMGRRPVLVNGVEAAPETQIGCGDIVQLRERAFRILAAESDSRPCPDAAGWLVESDSGFLYSVSRTPFFVGGGTDDDLIIADWPPMTLCLRIAQSALILEPHVPLRFNGHTRDKDDALIVRSGDEVDRDGTAIRVLRVTSTGQHTTRSGGGMPLPWKIRLQSIPAGGRLFLSLPGGVSEAYLPGRRRDLVVCLLAPPLPYRPGGIVPDDVLCASIWPDKPGMDRTDINTLVHRLRQDLNKVGIDGQVLLARVVGGVAFKMQRGAQVILE